MRSFKMGLIILVVFIMFIGINNSLATPIQLTLNDGLGNFVLIQDLNNDGVVHYNGALGAWTINITTGLTYPALGSTTQPILDLSSVNVFSANGGNLDIQVSAADYTWLGGEGVLSVGGTTPGTVAASAYYDSGNALFAKTTQIGSNLNFSFPPIAFSGQTIGNVVDISPATPYSLTIDVMIYQPVGGATSFDASVAVPEPGTLLFLGAGLLGLGFAIRRRKS